MTYSSKNISRWKKQIHTGVPKPDWGPTSSRHSQLQFYLVGFTAAKGSKIRSLVAERPSGILALHVWKRTISNFQEAKDMSNLMIKAKDWRECELPSFSAKSGERHNQCVMKAFPAAACTAILPEQKMALSDREARRNEPSTFTTTGQLPCSFHLPPSTSHCIFCLHRDRRSYGERSLHHWGSAAAVYFSSVFILYAWFTWIRNKARY